MTTDNDTPSTTDPSLYPRLPDLPPPGEEDVVTNSPNRNAKTGAVAGIVAADGRDDGVVVNVLADLGVLLEQVGDARG